MRLDATRLEGWLGWCTVGPRGALLNTLWTRRVPVAVSRDPRTRQPTILVRPVDYARLSTVQSLLPSDREATLAKVLWLLGRMSPEALDLVLRDARAAFSALVVAEGALWPTPWTLATGAP